MGRPPRVKRISKEEGERVDIHRFPNFSAFGSVTGMRNALLVRCGSFIYNVSLEPAIYENAI